MFQTMGVTTTAAAEFEASEEEKILKVLLNVITTEQ